MQSASCSLPGIAGDLELYCWLPQALDIQLDAWAADLNQHAQASEAHNKSFFHATEAVKQLETSEGELSTRAALKFVTLDVEDVEVRQQLQMQDRNNNEIFDKPASVQDAKCGLSRSMLVDLSLRLLLLSPSLVQKRLGDLWALTALNLHCNSTQRLQEASLSFHLLRESLIC